MFKEATLPEGFPKPGPVGEIIVKEYPAYRLARVQAREGVVERTSSSMFRPLFDHIKRNDIPMTAPVEMGYASSDNTPGDGSEWGASSMAFLYGQRSWGQPGADEADQRVVVDDVSAMTVVSIGVRGSYTDARFESARAKLIAWTIANKQRVRIVGPPRYLGYNSPFVPWFLRYGEVQIPIQITERAGVGDDL